MSDAYLKFSHSMLGARLTQWLGLPRPVPLRRYEAGQAEFAGEVLVAGGGEPQLLGALADALGRMQAHTLAHASVPGWTALANRVSMMSGPWRVSESGATPIQAVVFDATGLQTVADAQALYTCFHEAVRAIQPCGRVLVIGRPARDCHGPEHQATQRGLEGFVRALGKELKRGITAQTVVLARGAETQLEGVLRFLLSPRSAYVSGQVMAVDVDAHAPACDPAQALAERRIMVTGAARGIGAAIAHTLARDGARVVCVDVPATQAELQAVAEQTGGLALPLDITQPDALVQLVAAARAEGGWDGVVHNAGITRDKTIARMAPHLWDSLVQVNLAAPLTITQGLLAANALRPAARVVCLSSISGLAGNPGQTNYAFSKAGLIGMVQAMAPSLAAQGMAINAVAPGFIETPMTAAMPPLIREAGRRMNALGQGGQAVDVAEAVAWLLNPGLRGINGQVLRVCGLSLIGA